MPPYKTAFRPSTSKLASMAKRKQSQVATRKGAKARTPGMSSTQNNRRGKSRTKSGASAAVAAAFEETRRRIKEIEKRALAKLCGKDSDQ